MEGTVQGMNAEPVVKMVTIKEASNLTGVSYDCIRKLCLQNKIVFIKAGCKYLINYDRFVEYLNAGGDEKK